MVRWSYVSFAIAVVVGAVFGYVFFEPTYRGALLGMLIAFVILALYDYFRTRHWL